MRKSPELEEEIKICKSTGHIERTYRISGRVCPKAKLSSHLAKQHAGYTLIDLDLEDVAAFLDEAYKLVGERTSIPPPSANLVDEYVLREKEPLPRVIKGLWFSAIVIYAKCFTEAKGRRLKLEKSVIPAHMRDCHTKMMNYRHTIIAHAGEGNLETADPELVISPKGSTHSYYWIKSNVKRIEFSDDRNEVINFYTLIKAVHQQVKRKRQKLHLELIKEARKTPLDTWHTSLELSSLDKIMASPKVAP